MGSNPTVGNLFRLAFIARRFRSGCACASSSAWFCWGLPWLSSRHCQHWRARCYPMFATAPFLLISGWTAEASAARRRLSYPALTYSDSGRRTSARWSFVCLCQKMAACQAYQALTLLSARFSVRILLLFTLLSSAFLLSTFLLFRLSPASRSLTTCPWVSWNPD